MVEYNRKLDLAFDALADPIRRDILKQVARAELTVGEIAKSYHLTFAAVSKHLMVLQRAGLIIKRRQGKYRLISLPPNGLKAAASYLQHWPQ